MSINHVETQHRETHFTAEILYTLVNIFTHAMLFHYRIYLLE
jgi:hypothetical protein